MKIRNAMFMTVFSAILGGIVAIGVDHYIVDDQKNITVSQKETISDKNDVVLAHNNGVIPTGVDFTYAAEVSTPGVVHIKTFKKQSSYSSNYQQSPFDDFFQEFFGDQYQGQRGPQIDQGPRQLGSGSGVVLSADGYIVTNNHVIKGADRIEVVLNDKRSYEAELIGIDPTTDLALLHVEEKELSFVRYGSSDDLKIGEWVLAVGNPFDLTSTVTAGIVSAKARNINILRGKENLAIESFIQTDAAVNPGNSGGALVNLKGELIGINTAIATPTGTYAGYSFAVPVTIVQKVMDDLLKYGEVQRALLGISIQDVDAVLAAEKELENVSGVYVAGVGENSAAEDAGLEENDVIIAISDVPVNSSSELQEQIARYRPGDKVNIKYIRDHREYETTTKLKNKLGTTAVVKKGDASTMKVMGMNLRPITEEEKEMLRLRQGVKVISLDDGKLKGQKMKKGFIITRVNKKMVKTPEEVQALINNQNGATLIEGIYPDGERAYYIAGW